MAKELPYFKFTPDEYLTGDITLLPWDLQGIFINVCAYYWKRDCRVDEAKLKQRYPTVTDEQWEGLSEIIIFDNGEAKIVFLDEQFNELLAKHKLYSDAGKKGAEIKQAKTQQLNPEDTSPPKATLKPPLSKEAKASLKHKDIDIDIEVEIDKDTISPAGEKAKTDFIDQIIDLFAEVHGQYQVLNRGMERKAAGKLLNVYKKKYPAATADETLTSLKSYFEVCVKIHDDWLRTNMSLPIIISKFNQINLILKNGTNKGNSGTTNERVAELVAKKFGSDSAE